MSMPDNPSLSDAVTDRDMTTVGKWQLVKKVVDRRANNQLGTPMESHYEPLSDPTESTSGVIMKWLHDSGKADLHVSLTPRGTYRAVIHKDTHKTDTADGITCGVSVVRDTKHGALDWAETMMQSMESVSRLYDEIV